MCIVWYREAAEARKRLHEAQRLLAEQAKVAG